MKDYKYAQIVKKDALSENKFNSGITLIALIVTIIILLILAGITINLALSPDGIIEKAQTAGNEYKKEQDKELAELGEIEDLLDKYTESSSKNITFTLEYSGSKDVTWDYSGVHNVANGISLNEWLESEGLESTFFPSEEEGSRSFILVDLSIFIYCDIPNEPIHDGDVFYFKEVGECVSGDSNVMVSTNGSTMLARDIKDGQDILFYNFKTNSVEVGTVKKVYGYQSSKNFIKYQFDDNTVLKVIDYHPIYTKEGWKSYTNRNGYPIPKLGDYVKTLDGWKKLINIEELSTSEDCYNYLIKTKNGESVKNFFANNTLVEAITKIK